jgi:hypothetical protein
MGRKYSLSRAPRRRRPVIHVVKRTNTVRPMQNGTQPPSRNLRRLAARKIRSTVMNKKHSGTALYAGQRHVRVKTTK